MIIGRIPNATRVLGQEQGYLGLPVRDVLLNDKVNGEGTPAMETAWIPDPGDLERLAAGAPIVLCLLGTAHPPVMMYVGDVPD